MAAKASPQVDAKEPRSQSTSSSSLHSNDGHFSLPPAKGVPVANSNGLRPDPPSRTNTAPHKKLTMSSRLNSMFGRGESHSVPRDKQHVDKVSEDDVSNGHPSPRIKPSRQGSQSDKSSATLVDRSRSVASDKKREPATSANPNSRRFWLTDDGTHEHHLKSMKRQEKLSNMLKEFMPGKRKESGAAAGGGNGGGGLGPHEEQPLSLMAGWVDQMRHDRDNKLASTIEKGGPNATLTLVQKYGKCQEIVGRGAFGIVRVAHKTDARDPKREQLFAVKEFRQRPGESDRKYQKRLTAEFCISSSMQHPNVIHTLDLLKDDKGDFCEVMEYCAGGDLYTLVLAAGQLEVAEADCYFKQLMRGVEYMHEMGVAHRDLKPENLLLTQHGSIKITDFGNGECFRMAWEKEAHMTAGLCGSAPYIAPEEYVDEEFDPRAVDVWACGVIYMAMRTGRHLWRVARKEEDEFYTRYLEDRKQEEGYRPIEVLRRQKCRNVIYSILDPNPTRRLTGHQVLLSEWVNDIKVCKAGNEGF